MTMSDKRILEAKDEGRIIIEPFDQKRLSTSSYDVRLGEYFYREQTPNLDDNIFNIYDPAHVERVWGECERAKTAYQIMDGGDWALKNIDQDDQLILLKPGETILGHTEEFIGGRENITTMMKARSSLGRSFILVCKCAGWGDVGYVNRWTMEITNVSQHYTIPLLVGSRVAQLIFMETGKILDRDYSQTGAYQKSADIEEIKRTWSPESMLPKIRP